MENDIQDSVLVDVVIAVHTPDRPIERAVASLLAGGLPTSPESPHGLRVTVVCHNTAVAPIMARVGTEHQNHVRFIRYEDGITSPAGPFNHGIALATGTWVSIMGSDDAVEPGALARWVQAAEDDNADVLIAPMAHAGGGPIRTPVVRRNRSARLDPVADRLTYRTAPLGLLRLSTVRSLELGFPTKYATGEDQLFSAKLWFSGVPISYGRGLPRYLVHDDAVGRVTATPRSITEDLAFATDLVESDWFTGLSLKERTAVVTKLVRIHVFSHVMLRANTGTWCAQDAAEMAVVAQLLLFAAPQAVRPLSVADRRLLDAVVKKVSDPASMEMLATGRRTFSSPLTWFPRDISALLHPEAPLRFMSASAFLH
ncbi:glycosyltransferase family 2 protein [Arthrobacter antibioticus]|uniref:glycosyltransferase family 2 protein n=1 Tax=Arthrobacter sp. H35-MC1 TaxID=3046203 RepID=UPI0024BA1ADF|nr:glycosyltransferase family 2 protein [Arthrobacter sp. H35-MC1]MDJ0316467.1 glycosyltransferase [Arthrobacter sp. H35-MC1]